MYLNLQIDLFLNTFTLIFVFKQVRVDKLSRKNIYISEENIGFEFKVIWTRNLDYVKFYWIWKSLGQQFMITLIRYFTCVGLENTCTRNLNYNYYVL